MNAIISDTHLSWLRGQRGLVLGLTDGFAWIVAFVLATGLRLDTSAWANVFFLDQTERAIPLLGVLTLGGGAALLHAALGRILRLHHGRAMIGSFEEMILLGSVTITVGAIATLVNILAGSMAPRSAPIMATFGCLVIAGWLRAAYRRMLQRRSTNVDSERATPALVVGAGNDGRQLVESMVRDPQSTWRPVGFVDDDPRNRHLRFRGVPVLGRIRDLPDVAEQYHCHTVVIAVPYAGNVFIRKVSRHARAAGLEVKIVPSVLELTDNAGIADLRDINISDVLGRGQVDTDVGSIAGYLSGKRVLVTGAGGSIGSELCRQIYRLGPAELMMLDRDESALHALKLEITGVADLDAPDTLLADVRDSRQLRALFHERRPEVVFHAAALKHVNMLERFPVEAVKTNVWGTLSVLEAADAVGVRSFVNVSTDKAADPCNVLGYTKRIAEGLTAEVASRTPGVFISVRFGNVLGSRGSVLTTFAAQVAAGGPVTVTHPEVTRYFMTVEESVQLVIQAGAIGRDGEALVLDMGDPIRIADVAEQLVQQSRKPVELAFTGLKPGEKMHETLFADGETDHRPVHPLISHVEVLPLARDLAIDLAATQDPTVVVKNLELACRQMSLDLVSTHLLKPVDAQQPVR